MLVAGGRFEESIEENIFFGKILKILAFWMKLN
jgi:hypothetical protein